MATMICWCALAGTKACEGCSRRAEQGNYTYKPDIISVPYTHPTSSAEEKRLQEIENAIKRLNDCIDEIIRKEK